jgi:hypothetical protein
MAIVEADFFFGRMNIHVITVSVHFEKQEGHRMLTFHEGGVVALAQAIADGAALNGAPIQKSELHLPGGTAQAWAADVALNADAFVFGGGYFNQTTRKLSAHKTPDPFQQILCRWQVEHQLAISRQGEGGAWVSNGVKAKLLLDMGILGSFRAQEFTAGRQIVEQVAHLNDGAGGAAAITHMDKFATVHFNLGAGERLSLLGGKSKAGDAGDARQGLAAKAEGVDGSEVLFAADLACGVAFQAEHGVLTIHARAVIDDFDGGGTAALDMDFDVKRSGIEAVLNQFSNHRGRAFHDFSCRHLTGQSVWKNADA